MVEKQGVMYLLNLNGEVPIIWRWGLVIIWLFPKIGGTPPPKMDGENNGKPSFKWVTWGENPQFSETSIWQISVYPITYKGYRVLYIPGGTSYISYISSLGVP